MKNILVIAIFLFTSSALFAQQKDPVTGGAVNSGTLNWSTGLAHDFGKIKQNEAASFTFEFTNSGKEPVTITNAKPSCSCTVPAYTTYPVAPGDKGVVKAIYNAHTPGTFAKTITVTTDKGETVVLKISGEVIQ